MPDANAQNPQIGILFYQDVKDSNGNIVSANLQMIDSPSDEDSANLTWVAQLEDFGNGMEVYIEPNAGGGPAPTEVATDENINFFITTILNEKNGDPKQKLNEWIELIETREDLEPLDAKEKERLIRLIKAKM